MTISAVLLAGGKSLRMGQDKATLLFRGVSLWQNQLKLLRRLGAKEICVSAQIDPSWRPKDVEFVADENPSRGPLGGVAAAFSRVTTEHLLVLGIDMPFMTEKYLRDLCGRVEPGRGIVPVIENRAEPLAAIYPREAAAEFGHALSGTDFSLQPLIRKLIALGKLRPIDVSPDEAPLFHNLNKPEDLADL
jgi:molybdopterin-guanine dinucleotide biosynthesis protein A